MRAKKKHTFFKRLVTSSVAVCLLVVSAPTYASNFKQALAAHGIQAIDPEVAAADFKLPTLQGSEIQLSDTAGRWVVLTFFATWCGPCMHEMPSLQTFHESHHPQGIDLLAVSTDDSPAPVRSMARKMGITFPILMDTQGDVAKVYKASSIPVSYLISPAGKLVGIARGARDWSKMQALVDTLLEVMPTDDEPAEIYAANAQAIELPTIFNPPTAHVIAPTGPQSTGTTFHIDVPITWSGNFSEYLLHPPTIALPEGATEISMTASTTSQAGSKVVTYRFSYQVEEPGDYKFDPIELKYTPRAESEPIRERVDGPTITVQGALASHASKFVGAGLAATLLLTIFGLLVLRKKQANADAERAPKASPETIRNKLQNARRLRMDGDIAGYLDLLSGVMDDLGAHLFEAQQSSLTQLREQVRYGGQMIDEPTLDLMERKVELELDTRRPNQDDQDKSSIEFVDEA
jgi:peroxiredoxin